MPRFAEQVEVAIEALSTNPPQAFEENEFIDASRLVYDGVRDIRKAVLMIRVSTDQRNAHARLLLRFTLPALCVVNNTTNTPPQHIQYMAVMH